MFNAYITLSNGTVQEKQGLTFDQVEELRMNPPQDAIELDVQFTGDDSENFELISSFLNS